MNTTIQITAEDLLPGDVLAHRGSVVRNTRISTRSMTRGSVIITVDLPDGDFDVFVVRPHTMITVLR